MTELALIGLAAAALATGTSRLLGLTRAGPLLPLRIRSWALAFVTASYAAASDQTMLFRILVPTAATLWASLFWRRTRRLGAAPGRPNVWAVEILKVFVLSCPMLAVLGGAAFAHAEATDYAAAGLFLLGAAVLALMPRLRTNPAVAGHLLIAAAFWVLAWREPSGILTLFAPLLAWAEGAPPLRVAQNGPAPMSEWTQLDPESAGPGGETRSLALK